MAGLHNLLLSITVVTMLASVYAMKLPFSEEAPSFPEDDILLLDKIEESQIIKHIEVNQDFKGTVVNEDLNGPVVPESCKHTTYCEEVINYPEEAASNLIAKLGKGVSLQLNKLDKPDKPEFAHRDSIDGNVKLCKAHDSLVYPRYGTGYDGRSHLLVNGKTEKEKVQGFRVQSCLKNDCQCSNVVLGYKEGYRGRCKQFYIYRTATALNMTSSTHAEQYQTHIKLPDYCACIAEPCIDNCNEKQIIRNHHISIQNKF